MKSSKRFRGDSEEFSDSDVNMSSSDVAENELSDGSDADELIGDSKYYKNNKHESEEDKNSEDESEEYKDSEDESEGDKDESEDDEDNDDSDEVESGKEDCEEQEEEDEEEVESEDEDEGQFPNIDAEDEIEKGKGIMAQSRLYNGILACRMKAQEAVTAMNQLPQGENYEYIASAGAKFDETIKDTKCLIQKTLHDLVKLQDQMLTCRSDIKFVASVKLISDEDDQEVEECATKSSCMKEIQVTGKRKMENYPEFLSKRQKLLNNYRDDTLEKTAKVVSVLPVRNSFANFESSTLVQIQQILLDKERLIRRTQLRRSGLPVIGKKEKEEDDIEQKSSRRQSYDVEIFDDSDFLNKLLTQHTSLKTANFTDMNAVSKEWAELNSLKKSKALVDRRASKGRKARYAVHRKLINFMTSAESENVYSDEQRDALAREVFRGQS